MALSTVIKKSISILIKSCKHLSTYTTNEVLISNKKYDTFNLFMRNNRKRSDMLKISCSECCKVFKSVSDHFGTLCSEGFRTFKN